VIRLEGKMICYLVVAQVNVLGSQAPWKERGNLVKAAHFLDHGSIASIARTRPAVYINVEYGEVAR